ncbi:unnamed protein product [Danaus chrysippus]|uniref:(African queen) hypothetical protein n=1 Tax=Danaus chrysippus TaxID=151541 RepID=A0A8J2W5W4_9NEOP|nr:unnamed protein product [Danaus chrysippus]
MDFQSAMETFAEAWAAANTAKSEVPSDLSQSLSSDLRRSKTPPRRSPEERAVPRPPSAPVHDRPSLTPHTPHLSPKKEAFNNLLNKGISVLLPLKSNPGHPVRPVRSSTYKLAHTQQTFIHAVFSRFTWLI